MEELALTCYGVEVRVADAAGLGLCQHLRDALPPEFVARCGPASAAISYAVTASAARRSRSTNRRPASAAISYAVTAAALPGMPERAGYRVARDGVEVLAVATGAEEDLYGWLQQDIDNAVAQRSRQMLFVRAGVVGWRGLAIVIPGRSLSGKSTLVEALIRWGAIYYSDEFAVLDDAGMVHSYARALDVPGEDRPPQDLRLEWEDVPREPLPMGLIVAGPYQPEAAWRPAILRGAQAVLPLIDNAVLAQEESVWTLQMAARVAPTVVTLQGPRPDAAEVAARLLDLIDTAFVSQAFDADEQGPSRLTADLAHVAKTQLASQVVWPLPPARRLVAARYLRMTDFLSPEDHQRLLEHALACEDAFQDSGVFSPEGSGVVNYGVRRSRTLSGNPLEEVWNLFDRRLRAILPAVRQELGISWFPVRDVERQLTAHAGGGFFAPHTDNGVPEVANRRISCVYYFYVSPRRFTGGELKLYDTWVMDAGSMPAPSCTTLAPIDNSIVFFPSGTSHEVCPVRVETEAFCNNRFAVTIWVHEGAWPAAVTGASAPA